MALLTICHNRFCSLFRGCSTRPAAQFLRDPASVLRHQQPESLLRPHPRPGHYLLNSSPRSPPSDLVQAIASPAHTPQLLFPERLPSTGPLSLVELSLTPVFLSAINFFTFCCNVLTGLYNLSYTLSYPQSLEYDS